MKKILAAILCLVLMASLSACKNGNNSTSNKTPGSSTNASDTTENSPTQEQDVVVDENLENTEVAPSERDLPESDYEEKGSGTIYVSTPGGTSEKGSIPVLYADANSWLIQIGLNASDFNGSSLSFIYIDGILNTKEQLANTQTSLTLSGNALTKGIHTVEVVQYENDDPNAAMTVYKSMQYEVKTK